MNKNNSIYFSVILPVFNGAKYLTAAIESILNQSYQNFELIIIDDGSTDNSWGIIQHYSDNPKVKSVRQENVGLAKTLNTGISLAKYDFIARQDQDDISLLDRFETQKEFLLEYPLTDVVGSWAQVLEEDKLVNRFLIHPTEDKNIKSFAIFDTPFVHTSVIIKKSSVIKAGLYSEDPSLQPPEDYELWTRMALNFNFANIPKVLIHYREVKGSMSRKPGPSFKVNMTKAGRKYIDSLFVDEPGLADLINIYHQVSFNNKFSLIKVIFGYQKIWERIQNKKFCWTSSVEKNHLKILLKNYLKLKLVF